MTQLWSWVLCVVGCTGMWIVGNKKRWGFLINIGSEAIWLAYAYTTRQWGFVPFALLYAGIYARNWRLWA